MTITWKELVPGLALQAAASTMYSCPSGTYAAIQAASITNPTAGVVVVNIYLVPPGQSAGPAYRISSRSVPAGSVLSPSELVNHKLEPGASISADGLGAYLTVSGSENVPSNS